MMWIAMMSLVFIGLYLVVQLILMFSVMAVKEKDTVVLTDDELPHISILVAARNEEENITQCLGTLHELDYPKNKLHILIGNDQSEDTTKEKVLQFIKNKPHFQLIDIKDNLGKALGKANVLAHLAHKANGEFYLITDADIIVNQLWAKELVTQFGTPKIGIISGITMVHGKGNIARLQGLDWLYFMGLLKGFDNTGLRCTAVGNNMAIRKEAYWSVGGYEELDFSVTEDYKLYKEVRNQKWHTRNIITQKSLNISQPVKSFVQLMHQRKRWLAGAKELPFYWWILFGLLASLLPAIIILSVFQPLLALQLYGIKWALQTLFILYLQHRLGLRQNVLMVLLYDVYTNIVSIGTQVFFVLPIKMQWKKRIYN